MDCELIAKSFFTFLPSVMQEYAKQGWYFRPDNNGWYIHPPEPDAPKTLHTAYIPDDGPGSHTGEWRIYDGDPVLTEAVRLLLEGHPYDFHDSMLVVTDGTDTRIVGVGETLRELLRLLGRKDQGKTLHFHGFETA